MAARGTTPTYTLTLNGSIDLGLAAGVYVTFRQAGRTLTKTGDDLTINGNVISVYLVQSETLGFSEREKTELQVNWVYADGSRGASKIVPIRFGPNLIPEVIEA